MVCQETFLSNSDIVCVHELKRRNNVVYYALFKLPPGLRKIVGGFQYGKVDSEMWRMASKSPVTWAQVEIH